MTRRAKYDLFVSYSRLDSQIVQPMVNLFRLNGRVFFDLDSIAAGELWEPALKDAIAATKKVVVCWCCHSQQSLAVATEIDAALAVGTRIVPVRLCATPLPPALAPYQALTYDIPRAHACRPACPTRAEREHGLYRTPIPDRRATDWETARICAAIEEGLDDSFWRS